MMCQYMKWIFPFVKRKKLQGKLLVSFIKKERFSQVEC